MARGRKSTNSLLTVVPVSGQRLAPPDDLDESERKEWLEIVQSLPADYFRPSDVSLLAAYCSARAFYRAAAALMKAEGVVMRGADRLNNGGDVIGRDKDYPHPAHAVLTSQASALAQMAVKLRLCPSSRYSEKQAATKTQSVSPGAKPWEAEA